MAIVGTCRPVIAPVGNQSTGTYAEAMELAEAVEYSMEFETSDKVDFYADNSVAETSSGVFSTGTLSLSVDNLSRGTLATILGSITVNMGSSQSAYVLDNTTKAVPVGFGILETNIVSGVKSYKPIVLPNITFNIPEFTATTLGEEIEFTAPELTANINRLNFSGSMGTSTGIKQVNSPWLITFKKELSTENEGLKFLKDFFKNMPNIKV